MNPRIGMFAGAASALLGVGSALKGLGAVISGKDMAAMQLTVCVVIGWVLCFVGWHLAGKPGFVGVAMPDPMAASASRSMQRLDRTRQFPEIDIRPLVLPDGERALLCERSSLFGQPAPSKTSGGSRVTIGQQTFYFGRSEPFTSGATKAAAQGRLILTDRALVFHAECRTVSIDLTRVTSIEPYSRDAVIVCTERHARPRIFLVANPILWSMVARMAMQVPLGDGRIPDRVIFDVGTASAVMAA